MKYSKAQRVAYAKKVVGGLKTQLDNLADSVVTDPQKLEKFAFKWNKGFRHYSLNNTMLIFYQNPEATLVAGRKQWKERYDREVVDDKPIHILAPSIVKDRRTKEPRLVGFRYASVFDIKQTKGEPIELGAEEYTSGDSKITFENLKRISPVEVTEKELGTIGGRAWSDGIEINENRKERTKIKTFSHELGHLYLGHLKDYIFTDEIDSQAVQEVEAEAVSYLVSTFLGIKDEKAAHYIGHWGGDKELLKGRGKKILTVAEKIIRQIIEFEDNQSS